MACALSFRCGLAWLVLAAGCGGGSTGAAGRDAGIGGPAGSGTTAVGELVRITPRSASVGEGAGAAAVYVAAAFTGVQSAMSTVHVRADGVPLQALAVVQDGSVYATLELSTGQPHDFALELWIEDLAGQASNVISAHFPVTQDLDVGFGRGGLVVSDDVIGGVGVGFDEIARGIALQADGRIVTAGYFYDGLRNRVLVQRFLTDGSPDTSFGSSGSYRLPIQGAGPMPNEAFAVRVAPDGKILVAGYACVTQYGGRDVLLLRLDPDGVPDATFGVGGVVTTPVDYDDEAHALALQPDGSVVVAGSAAGSNRADGLVLRYTPEGVLDSNFGTGGIARYADAAGGWDAFFGVAVQADGRIVVTGSASTAALPGFSDVAVVRLLANGAPDPTFGNGGAVRFHHAHATGTAVALQASGRIVVGGGVADYNSYQNGILALGLRSDGSLDPAFGEGGVFFWNRGLPDGMYANGLALSGDGGAVLVGSLNQDLLVVRLTPDGMLDGTHSFDGLSEVTSGGIAYGLAVAVQPGGEIVVAGASNYHDQYSDAAVFLARLRHD